MKVSVFTRFGNFEERERMSVIAIDPMESKKLIHIADISFASQLE